MNATKIFNSGAIIATPKGNSLRKNMSYDVEIVKIGPFVFSAQLSVLLDPLAEFFGDKTQAS